MGLKIYSEQFRDEVLKLNLKTPPDVVFGLVNLSGSALYSAYLDALGKDALIKTDKASVIVKNPGDIINDSITPRQRNLNKNLQTPIDVITGLRDITNNQTLSNQYLSGRGLDTTINDFNIKNPGDVVTDSVNHRNKNLNRNLKTPKDITDNTPFSDVNSLGLPTTIGDSIVLNPGTIEDTAKFERRKLFSKNKPININDPSENDPLYAFLSRSGYTYTSLLQSIGNLTLINNYDIPNAISVSLLSNQTPEVSLELQLQQNRYYPVEYNQFEATVKSLKATPFSTPYANAYKSGVFTYNASQNYEPSSFLNLKTSINPISLMTNSADPLSFLLNNKEQPLKDETLLMNIAALELKFNFQARINQAVEREIIGRTSIDEALTNPIAAANIIRNPFGWFNLFERNNTISVPSTFVGKAAQFAADLAGLTNPINLEFALSTDDDLAPKCFGNQIHFNENGEPKSNFDKFVDNLTGRTLSRKEDRDAYFIRRTGAGQRYSLFYNVGKNKYQPDYLADQETTLFLNQKELQVLRRIGGYFGIGAGENPEGRYYIGNKAKYDDPFYMLQDADGHQVRSSEVMIDSLKKQNPNGLYEEPGYSGSDVDNGQLGRPQGVSEYGSLKTNFIWKSATGKDSVIDFITNQPTFLPISIENGSNLLSVNKYKANKFRECSILYTTSQLLEKGIQTNTGVFNSPIDQTITKFYDGYDFMSRANATILPKKVERFNKQGDVIGYRYLVPGLDSSGKRNDKELYDKAELCRVWTKPRPYSKITDLVRYKELIRKERNSVIDRFGNYNIFPSELNVNEGYGRSGEGSGDAIVEFSGERRARKYMFSIENLAWRDYTARNYFGNTELPACEKGMNGGRVMWFPPYDIQFTDNTTANWTAHQFLGRPEPIYTYNNTERTGTLSWKIVVDHPSILNLLTQKELARLTDGEVDELLSAFWAGCLEFDVFELARIWNQFSESDIDYFKKVIADLDLTKTNEQIKPKVENVSVTRQPGVDQNLDINAEKPKSLINGKNLFFENDVPLNPNDFNKNNTIYDTGKIESYDVLYNQYHKLVRGIDITNNAEATKNNYRSVDMDPDWVRYDYTIGYNSAENYFRDGVNKSPWYGIESQYDLIEKDLSDSKYRGFDLTITIEAHASPLAPDNNNTVYNDNLSRRRFISVTKWLLTKVMNKSGLGKLYFSDETEVTSEKLDTYLQSQTSDTLTFKRESGKLDGVKDDITFVLKQAKGITPKDAIRSMLEPPVAGPNNDIYYLVDAPRPGTTNKVTYCCFETDDIANKAINENWLINGQQFPADRIGTISAKGGRPYKDVVCGALSITSSYARRVTLDIAVNKKIENKPKTETVIEDTIIVPQNEQPLNNQNITKRDIAQRIINKMITECDYFELLKSDTPFLYDSLKQKLKYFQPAFHAITPEGLNARLTFLQQCLRPGETIKRKVGDDFCDANNTAFGKPPICVLRIGDFYNTKIIIDNLSISYDPLVWDLNPEGIGAQPMIANVQLSFKYIGGSGLRKYVDELQNALSFNYYANADVYDDRTFANKDLFERNLINLERSFFDNNTLDLIPIVNSAERIVPADFTSDIPYGTIGNITKKRLPTTAGGNYSNDILTAKLFNPSTIYQPYEIVANANKFYIRKADNEKDLTTPNTLNGTGAPLTNKNYWEEVSWRNYGEQAFNLEFNSKTNDPSSDNQFLDKSYFNWYEVEYKSLFTELYKTYATIVTNNNKFNTINKQENLLLDLLLNKNYNKTLTNTNKLNLTDILNDINQLPYQNGVTGENGLVNLYETFSNEANERGYMEYGSYNELTPNVTPLTNSNLNTVKLHLYPQNSLYKIGNGLTVVPSNGTFDDATRFNPGNLTGGYVDNNKETAEVAGIFLKNYSKHATNISFIIKSLATELETKFKLNISHFWFYDGVDESLYRDFLTYFDETHKEVFNNFLSNKLLDYVNNLSANKLGIIDDIQNNTAKFVTISNALSVVLDGYDIKKDESKVFFYEVIPNAFELKTNASTLFGYDPYYTYKTLSFSNFQLLSLKDVRNVIYDRNNGGELQFLSLGNGTYFFKQISKDSEIKSLSGNKYTSVNNLPESIAIKNNIEVQINGVNFEVSTGITLNTKLDKNGLPGQTTTSTIQAFDDPYRMKYTFEKINYEFFEFSNKTIDVMLNDNYLSKEFDLDLQYNTDFDFYQQLVDLNQYVAPTPLTFNEWLDANPDVIITPGEELLVNEQYESYLRDATPNYTAQSLFYNGTKTTLEKIPLNYYTLNGQSVSGTTTNTVVNSINFFATYVFTITDKFIERSGRPMLTMLKDKQLILSGLLEMFFIDFFASLTESDKNELILAITNIEPKSGITNDGKTKATKIDVRKRKITTTVNSIFDNFKKYVTKVNGNTKNVYDSYTENAKNVNGFINEILTGDYVTADLDVNFITNKLLKGDLNDYTLVIKDTKEVKGSALSNYMVFTNTRGLFNIIPENNVNESVEEINETELSKYLKE
jgi:hypothetical protein